MPDKSNAPRRAEDRRQDPRASRGRRDRGRTRRIDIGKLRAPDRPRDARPGVHEHRLDQERDHLPRRRAGASCATAASRSSELAEKSTFVEVVVPAHLRPPAEQAGAGQVLRGAHAPLDDSRGHEALLRRLSRRRRTRWRSCRRWCCRCRASTREALDVKNRDEQRRRPSRACSRRCGPSPPSRTRSRSASRSSTRRTTLSYCANFLNMMFSVPAEPYEIDEEIVKVLNLLLILHADHEQNCSTSTVRRSAARRPTCSPRSRPASARSGARCTAAPTRRCSRCWRQIQRRRRRRRRSSSTWPRRRTRASA